MKPQKMFEQPLQIRFRGLYDYDGLISLIRDYYARVKIDNLNEGKFKHKAGGSGTEVEFQMDGDRKVTHFIKVKLEIQGHLWDVKQKEHTINGEKKTLTGGKLELFIMSKVQFDYADGFKNDKGWQGKIDQWMKEMVTSPTGLSYGDNKMTGEKFAERLATDLHDAIKKHLNMTCA